MSITHLPWLIPAHAGKTRFRRRNAPGRWAHPRSRGENSDAELAAGMSGGSSPLTRGKRRDGRQAGRLLRLIPAHAGKTGGGGVSPAERPAHPRSRGENHPLRLVPGRYHGSSPLTRGKPLEICGATVRIRLIPAHAGKTRGTGHYRPAPAAHPRSRGENKRRQCPAYPLGGSSPLTRGKPSSLTLRPRTPRLIPAHAGKTRSAPPTPCETRAHPRSRGENLSLDSHRIVGDGSSPLTRGKPEKTCDTDNGPRLIPAHAGKTRPWLARSR